MYSSRGEFRLQLERVSSSLRSLEPMSSSSVSWAGSNDTLVYLIEERFLTLSHRSDRAAVSDVGNLSDVGGTSVSVYGLAGLRGHFMVFDGMTVDEFFEKVSRELELRTTVYDQGMYTLTHSSGWVFRSGSRIDWLLSYAVLTLVVLQCVVQPV